MRKRWRVEDGRFVAVMAVLVLLVPMSARAGAGVQAGTATRESRAAAADGNAAPAPVDPQPPAASDSSASAALPPAANAPAPEAPAVGTSGQSGDSLSDLEDLLATPIEVWTATKTARSLDDAPAIVTVVTRDDLSRWGYRSIAGVLAHVLGFYVVDDHVIPDVAVRGVAGGLLSESGNIKVMLDGHAVSFRSTGGNWLGPELVPLTAIERIEIIRGPASALYGADAFLGVVNIITRDGADLRGESLRVAGAQTLDGLGYDADVSLGGSGNGFHYLLSARLDDEDRSGLELPRSSPILATPGFDETHRRAEGLELASRAAFGSLRYDLSAKSHVQLSAHFSSLARGAEFAHWQPLANGLDEQGRRTQTLVALYQYGVDANAVWAFSDELQLTLDASHFGGGPSAADQIEVGSDLFYVRREFGYRGAEVNLEGRWQPHQSFTAVLGAGLIYDREQLPSSLYVLKEGNDGAQAGDVVEASSTRQGDKSFLNPGAYLQLLWTPFEPLLSLTGGLRFDQHNIYGNQVSGRLGGVLSPSDSLHIKLLYGSAFKAPPPWLLYGVPLRTGDIVGNPELAPQYVHTFEAQVAYRPMDEVSLTSAVSYSYLRNKAEFTQQGLNQAARNAADVGALSFETELAARYRGWVNGYLRGEVNYTVRNIEQEGYYADLLGWRNPVYPPYAVHAGLIGTLASAHVRGTLEASYFGPRRATDSNTLEAGRRYELPAYALVDLSLSTYGLMLLGEHETTVVARAQNLLDDRTADPGFAGVDYPRQARTLFLELRQEL